MRGLIPAHAGKTPGRAGASRRSGAHPRSRGENLFVASLGADRRGSSPLTRGKLGKPDGAGIFGGLIPAHAGKTCSIIKAKVAAWAHPRSRGENQDENIINLSKQGSSPLTRGKLARAERRRGGERLIPAHAGKTEATALVSEANTAHPRSRGENGAACAVAAGLGGSSPLTRGKPCAGVSGFAGWGLIPAHAGKTSRYCELCIIAPAHPRSRGENFSRPKVTPLLPGSSPLTRGKPAGRD